MKNYRQFASKIITAWNEFEGEHDKQPTKLHLTQEEEKELFLVLPSVSSKLAELAFTKGVRVAVHKIYGFNVVYGATKFGFE